MSWKSQSPVLLLCRDADLRAVVEHTLRDEGVPAIGIGELDDAGEGWSERARALLVLDADPGEIPGLVEAAGACPLLVLAWDPHPCLPEHAWLRYPLDVRGLAARLRGVARLGLELAPDAR